MEKKFTAGVMTQSIEVINSQISANEAQGFRTLEIPFPNLGRGQTLNTKVVGYSTGTGTSSEGKNYQLIFVHTPEGKLTVDRSMLALMPLEKAVVVKCEPELNKQGYKQFSISVA